MIHQPDPTKHEDMLEGLIKVRQLHLHAIEQTGFTCADEMLYPENDRCLSDSLSYVAVWRTLCEIKKDTGLPQADLIFL